MIDLYLLAGFKRTTVDWTTVQTIGLKNNRRASLIIKEKDVNVPSSKC